MGVYIFLSIFFAFLTSVTLTKVTLVTNNFHCNFSADHDISSIQKIHKIPTSRIGGVSVFFSFLLILIVDHLINIDNLYGATLSASALLVFVIGTLEDLTKVVTPLIRVSVITISAIVAIYVTGSLPIITYTDFRAFEQLIEYYPFIGVALSLFCAVGLTNAYNIIDGFNGLTSTAAMINILGIMMVGFFLNDILIIKITGILLAAILGFWVFNYPQGKIFLGDGGAYVIGFIIAVISVYVIHMHKNIISPYAVLLMAIYPITEIGFSIFRRRFLHQTKCMQPDAMHLHQLVYYRCIPRSIENRNAMVMPIMLFFIIPQTILGVIFYKSTLMCLLLILLYIAFYVLAYISIVRFKTFNFLKILMQDGTQETMRKKMRKKVNFC